jgi:hypothetical protein
MSEHVKSTQQQDDTQTQNDLTAKVGVKLTTPEKSTSSSWSSVKRFFRVG